jgi:hypothetical protein
MNEQELLHKFAKAFKAEDKLKQIEEHEHKEQTLLRNLSKHLNVPFQERTALVEDVPADLLAKPSEQIKEVVTPGQRVITASPIPVASVDLPLPPSIPVSSERAQVTKSEIEDIVQQITTSHRKEMEIVKQSLREVHNFASRISQMGGGGEVNMRYLDDVNRSTMTPSNDNWVLEYDATTKKAQFTKDVGPIESVTYDTAHIDDHTTPGVTCWSSNDNTLNIHHRQGVTQQVGQHQYMLVNNTARFRSWFCWCNSANW